MADTPYEVMRPSDRPRETLFSSDNYRVNPSGIRLILYVEFYRESL